MAGADTSKVRLKLEEIVVPDDLVEGNKFLKWDEDSSSAIPVTLKVDAHGHFLYWKIQNKEGPSSKLDVECLELTQLRDTRTGKYAMTPKDAKLSVLCDMGSKDVPLEDKTLTVVYGSEIVSLNFTNFCGTSEKVAQQWCETLLKLAHNRSAQNPSPGKLLHKMYTKIIIMVNRDGHIPVKNIRKMFASSNSDRKKVETALQVAGVHSGKDDTIDPKKFTYDVFFTFYLRLVNQKEVDRLFQEMGARNKPYLQTAQLVKFLNNEQRDPRLNEILYPFYDAKTAISILERFEKNKQFAKKGNMSIEGLIRYLISDDNQVDGLESYLIAQDMEQPLAHYFIKSSHNTYLTGHQLTGKSTVEIYRQVLLSGCRCVELDCWDGKGDTDPEPVITHGYTMCTDVLFKDVIEAINETAFKTSEYPVILSFENHCNQKQQAKMAHYCRTIFGDKLLIDPLPEFPLEAGKPQPCPAALKNKILVKNKKRKHTDASKKRAGKRRFSSTSSFTSSFDADESTETPPSTMRRGRRLQSTTSLTSMDSGDAPSGDSSRPTRSGKGVKTIEETAETPEQNGEGSVIKEGVSPSTPEDKPKTSRTEGKPGSKVSSTPKLKSGGSKDEIVPPVSERKTSKGDVTVKSDDVKQRRKLSRQEAQDEDTDTSKPPPPRVKRKMSKQESEEKSGDVEMNGENGDAGNDSKLTDVQEDDDEESDESDDEEALSKEEALKKLQEKKDRGTAGQEAEAGAEMSALVNYVQPVHFSTFEGSDKRNHSYEISSFVETSAMNRVKENPVEFVNYNKRQLSRIYPKGTRVDSSNFMPQIFWNVGCQLVALNYQNLDLPMQLNLGLFNLNGRTGYILKPDFMRRKDRHFDPFAESTMDGIVAATVEVKVLSGQFLKKVGTYIEVDMFGLPADTVRKKYKTKTINNTGINPQYEDDGFIFPKVIMPKLAMLRITAYDDNNKQIGHRILPVESLRPGYRHIPLRNELYQPLLMPSVFVHIKVKDYVPVGLANFADALVNPIQHQLKMDEQVKIRTEALSILLEEAKLMEESKEAAVEDSPDDMANTSTPEPQKEETGEGSSSPEQESKPPIDNAAIAEGTPSNKPLEHTKLEMLEKRDSVDALPPTMKKVSRPSRQSVVAKDSIGSSTSSGGLLRSVSMGTAQFEANAFSGFHNQSIRSRSTPNLVPQEEIVAATIDEIKVEKKYVKVKTRLDNELNKLVKKQEKKQSKLKKGQSKDITKFKMSQEKARRNKEKKLVSMEKKMLKNTTPEEAKQQSAKTMEQLEQEQEKEMLKKQVSQEDALIGLYRRHYLEEKELKVEHAEMLFELQMDLMAAIHEKQLKKLDGQHKKVEQELRKMLGSKNIEEMKSIGKMKREKQEISRLKREARKKHIDQAVDERTHLIKLQENKKKELKDSMKELQQNLSQEEDDMVLVIEEEYKKKTDHLVQDRKFKRLTSDTNGSIKAMDDLSPSDGGGQNGLNGDMKKSASSGLNGMSDGPSSVSGGGDVPDSNGLNGHSNGNTGSPGHHVKGHMDTEVEVHASGSLYSEEVNTNNSAQTHSNGDIANGLESSNTMADEEIVCKDLETGERKVCDSPARVNPVVESTKL
ncbi:1-phosphatidylinositol 4,5-bisphosphate phosphodiesterase beta-1 isoform X4 [Strongylocentrotus purpuratus]|uniref:Phosphoinositide phospholipase C n=1 Tax=Strongylocentrotus purpuratus TaxID=7668 RepID=A0A7M7PRE3_STRPU|nr:1-phosphatidylinositol 4,5-bisphosphate phosphodiesterase beta-1 isoform X4 [Strongylocentrotus purpuratus]